MFISRDLRKARKAGHYLGEPLRQTGEHHSFNSLNSVPLGGSMAKDLLIVLLLAGMGFLLYANISTQMKDVYNEGINTGYKIGINQCPKVEYRPS